MLLALLQPIEADTLPALGAALLRAGARRHRACGGRARGGRRRSAAREGRRRAAAARRPPGGRQRRSGARRSGSIRAAAANGGPGHRARGGAGARRAAARTGAGARRRSRCWSISSSPTPKARWCRRRGGRWTRRAGRCRRHEPARLRRAARAGLAGAAPRASLRLPVFGRRGAVAARPDGRRPGRPPQGLRPRLPRAGAGRQAEWFLNYRGGSFLLPADGATSRDAALAGVTTEPLDDGQLVEIRGEIQRRQHGRGPAGEGAQGGGLRAAQRGALGRCGDDGAQLRRHQVREDLGPGGRRAGAAELRLAAPASRGLHRPVLQVLPQLRRRALAGGDGGAEPLHGASRSASPRCRRRSARWRTRSRGTSSGAAFSSRCAPPPRPSTSRSPPRASTSRRRTPTARPMDPRRQRARCTGTGRSRSRTRGWS